MKSFTLTLITAVASAVNISQFDAVVLPVQQTFSGYQAGSTVSSYEPTSRITRQQGRFVDLCPNAGKCDFSPDQKIGGEIIKLDTASLGNIATADLGSSDWAQNMRYEELQRAKQSLGTSTVQQQLNIQQDQMPQVLTTYKQWNMQPQEQQIFVEQPKVLQVVDLQQIAFEQQMRDLAAQDQMRQALEFQQQQQLGSFIAQKQAEESAR